MTMAISQVLPDTPLELEQPKSEWHHFLLDHIDTFAKLAWYLVADEALVECVMMRAAARLEGAPFDVSDALLTYKQARRALIGEAVTMLSQQREMCRNERVSQGIDDGRRSHQFAADSSPIETAAEASD
jgi:hypothetical protein